MAALDYGSVVFKNGKRYKPDELFPNIDELDIYFYKNYMCYPENYVVDGREYTEQSITFGWDDKKSYRFNHKGSKYWIKEICPRVYKCEISTGTDKYFIVFGYGVDNSKKTWEELNFMYLGKKNADKVDRVLNRFSDWRYDYEY